MIYLKASAKLNLNLHIIPKKNDEGLYPVRFINCQLDMEDTLSFELSAWIEIIWNAKEQIRDQENLIYKAAMALQEYAKVKKGVRITVDKKIPMKAGFGGGSSDAAATLIGLCRLWDISIEKNELSTVANRLGKDVPYFITGGLCQIEGTGEVVRPLSYNAPNLFVVGIVPEYEKPSTGFMYEALDKTMVGKNLEKVAALKEGLLTNNTSQILANLYNDFERVANHQFPRLGEIHGALRKAGAEATLMAGAGLSVAGFFTEKATAEEARQKLRAEYKTVFLTQIKHHV